MSTCPESSAPYISVVVAARNDNHGGNMIGRMQAFVDSWIIQASRYDLSSEIVVVEWNPPADRPRLMDELRWPEDMGPCEVRFIEVPREAHDRLPQANVIPLHQMIAKNAGIRRARGQFVLATNLDIIFSAELMRFLGERRLERRKMYRMDRTDVASYLPAGATVDELLAFCESHMLRIFAREGVMNLSGNGRRVIEDEDIVGPAEGIWLGTGWNAIEQSEHRPYRWMEPEAEIVFERPPEAAPRLLIDAEVGPSAGGYPLVVEVVSPAGHVLTFREGRRNVQTAAAYSGSPVLRHASSTASGPQTSARSNSALFDAPRFRTEMGSPAQVAGGVIARTGNSVRAGNHCPGTFCRSAHGSACDPAGTRLQSGDSRCQTDRSGGDMGRC